MDLRGDDRVDVYRFVLGCRAWGYAGNAEHLFELLDLDKKGYLSLEGTSWIAGGGDEQNLLFEDGDGPALGQFAGLTRAQARRRDFKEREIRMQKDRFQINSRRDHAGLKVSNEAIRRSQTSAMRCHPQGQAFATPGTFNDLAGIPITRAYKSFSVPPSTTKKNLGVDTLAEFTTTRDIMTASSTRSLHSSSGRTTIRAGSSMMTPGKGGWTMSKLGMARIANKEWREGIKFQVA